MSRQPSNSQRKPARKLRPALEGLEARQLLSAGPSGAAVDTATPTGVLSHHNRQFKYQTPDGGTAVIVIQGHGNLLGTKIVNTASGGTGLFIEYADTNTFSKILGNVYGGNGLAPLEGIVNRNLVDARPNLLNESPPTTTPPPPPAPLTTDDISALNNLSGVGGNPLQSVILNQWNLVAGGNINLTSGVNTLVLNSIAADTQVHLRNIPVQLQPTALVANSIAVYQSLRSSRSLINSLGTLKTLSTSGQSGSSSSSGSSGSSSSGSSGSSSSGSSSSSSSSVVTHTLPIGTPTPITNANGTIWTYKREADDAVLLTGVSGSFTAQPNEVEPLPPGQPPQTPPPAPNGIILKVNSVNGATEPIDVQTDPVVWGYDATKGEVLQFNLNLDAGTGVPVTNGPIISVPKNLPALGLNLGWNGSQLDLLVGYGSTVYAYNATSGLPDDTYGIGKTTFTTSMLTGFGSVTSIGSTDTVTVLGDGKKLVMIDLPASLQNGSAQPNPGPAPFTPKPPLNTSPSTFMVLSGLTGLPGSTNVYAAIAATFNTLQPQNMQLGFQPANTVAVTRVKKRTYHVQYKFNGGKPVAFTALGSYTNVTGGKPGSALGSVDSNLAVVINPPASNLVALVNPTTGASVGGISLMDSTGAAPYPDPIIALSSTFRPDLSGTAANNTGPALIDIQGDVQSFRGRQATGMVFNDTGNLNLVKFVTVTNSTIIGQPLSHVQIDHTANVTLLTPARTLLDPTRGGVTVDPNLQQIGPLSLNGD
jgi:hypothetical protein